MKNNSEIVLIATNKSQYKKGVKYKRVTKEKNIDIYIHTNEITNHYVPHVHISYGNDIEYVVSLIDYNIIKPESYKEHIANKMISLLGKNINEARKTWNEYSNIVKFKVDKEGNYTNQVVERM